MPRLHLVEPRGVPLVRRGLDGARFWRGFRWPYRDSGLRPCLSFLPLSLGNRALQVGEGLGWDATSPVSVAECEEVHAMGIRLVRCQL
jgi:hypothetical protein